MSTDLEALRALLKHRDWKGDLRFDFAQGPDQTGDYYTSLASIKDDRGLFIDMLSGDGDWCDDEIHLILAAVNALPALIAEITALRSAAESAREALHDVELNLYNYDAEDVFGLNEAAADAWNILNDALQPTAHASLTAMLTASKDDPNV